MKTTAVEWLEEQMPTAFKNLAINKQLIEQAKQKENQQSKKIWDSAQYDMRKQFRSSAYKGMTFEEWLEQYSKVDNI